MPVFLVSFKHPHHNIKGQAQVVASEASEAKELFCKTFNETLFEGYYYNEPVDGEHVDVWRKTFWDEVEFTVIDVEVSPVFNFFWEKIDPRVARIFRN